MGTNGLDLLLVVPPPPALHIRANQAPVSLASNPSFAGKNNTLWVLPLRTWLRINALYCLLQRKHLLGWQGLQRREPVEFTYPNQAFCLPAPLGFFCLFCFSVLQNWCPLSCPRKALGLQFPSQKPSRIPVFCGQIPTSVLPQGCSFPSGHRWQVGLKADWVFSWCLSSPTDEGKLHEVGMPLSSLLVAQCLEQHLAHSRCSLNIACIWPCVHCSIYTGISRTSLLLKYNMHKEKYANKWICVVCSLLCLGAFAHRSVG